MKKLVSLVVVFVLALSCFVGCESSEISNEISSEISSKINFKDGPTLREVESDVASYIRGRGYSTLSTEFEFTDVEYDNTTDTCIVSVSSTVYELRDSSRTQRAGFRLTYKRSTDGTWEQQGEYPQITSGFFPDIR